MGGCCSDRVVSILSLHVQSADAISPAISQWLFLELIGQKYVGVFGWVSCDSILHLWKVLCNVPSPVPSLRHIFLHWYVIYYRPGAGEWYAFVAAWLLGVNQLLSVLEHWFFWNRPLSCFTHQRQALALHDFVIVLPRWHDIFDEVLKINLLIPPLASGDRVLAARHEHIHALSPRRGFDSSELIKIRHVGRPPHRIRLGSIRRLHLRWHYFVFQDVG